MDKKIINIKDMEFIKLQDKNINMLFSTAKNNVSFKIGSNELYNYLDDLKEDLNLKDFKFLEQIHGNKIYNIDKDFGLDIKKGDGLYTKRKSIAIGVFTADCVPVILYDNKNNIISAVHSGWKGTFEEISGKAVDIFIKNGSNPSNIKVIIGPHICSKCYEVSEELIEKFKSKDIFNNFKIHEGRFLNLENCVKSQLLYRGIKEENIISLKICTLCEKNIKLHSYRKDKENSGRLISFIYMN